MSDLDDWTAAVCAELGIGQDVADVGTVLDLARDVAHGVARPAAPLTAYLVGVAVGRGESQADAAQRVTALAERWARKSAGE
ncbi:MAG TPA: DUF6457 domain-containing protein [Streptosporangiaceae bacterium]|jgi:hypothetical protein|nr:DUF6457 domain-containing protein [Streptosporangiaceae bacterium]